MDSDRSQDLRAALRDHLSQWGLRRFTSDADYFNWQRQTLSSLQLSRLHEHVKSKRSGSPRDEAAFYDAAADPHIFPVLYSQRYDYYVEIGSRVASKLRGARTVLDFGCGPGILTTFYAERFPGVSFVGIDRSPGSVARAVEGAGRSGLTNVRFACVDILRDSLPGPFDAILATHALVQAEHDPGLPSRDWTTFERQHDPEQQRRFEQRTGIYDRLERLCASSAQRGRFILFEKTRPLARRVPFQRALAARGLSLLEPPELVRYCLVEEVADDGPLYVLERDGDQQISWDEAPEPDEGGPIEMSRASSRGPSDDDPLYENHHPSAQRVWERLCDKVVVEEVTRAEPDGRQLHVELGRAREGCYLYCANTFDQRQLVVVEPVRAGLVESYYREITARPPSG